MNEQDSVFDGGWKIDTDANTLIAYLWEQADDPEVVEAVDSICSVHGMSRTESEGLIEALMQALIGPRPAEQENANEQ